MQSFKEFLALAEAVADKDLRIRLFNIADRLESRMTLMRHQSERDLYNNQMVPIDSVVKMVEEAVASLRAVAESGEAESSGELDLYHKQGYKIAVSPRFRNHPRWNQMLAGRKWWPAGVTGDQIDAWGKELDAASRRSA